VEKPWTASKNSKNGTAHRFSTELGKPAKRMPVSHKRQQAGGAPSRRARSVSLFPNERNMQSTESSAGNTINPSTKSGQAQTSASDDPCATVG
jgi:hypothetical protein